jgi:hypothetical protein
MMCGRGLVEPALNGRDDVVNANLVDAHRRAGAHLRLRAAPGIFKTRATRTTRLHDEIAIARGADAIRIRGGEDRHGAFANRRGEVREA